MQFDNHLTISSRYNTESFIHYVKTLSLSASAALKITVTSGSTNSQYGDSEVTTSTGRKVPSRNPKAKPWVSPYGGKGK